MGKLLIPPMGGGGVGSDELTAVLATDVVTGKTAVTSDSNDEAGIGGLADKNDATQQATPSLDTANSRLQMTIPVLGRYNANSKLYAAYATVANLIGLTAGKLVGGNNVLGVNGTALNDATISSTAQVRNGVIAYGKNGARYAGTMAERGASTITPSKSVQTIAANQYLTGTQTIAAIPTQYQNINTNQYLFNAGSFGNLAGGAVKGISNMFNTSNAQWCSSYGYAKNLEDASNDTKSYGYYGIVDGKYLVVRCSSGSEQGIVFKKSLPLQHYNKINIVFGAFKSSFATGITESSNNGLNGGVSADIFNIAGRKPFADDGGVFFTTSEFTTLRVQHDGVIVAAKLYSIDISSINYEAYLIMRFKPTYSDMSGSYWYIREIYLSQ